MVYLEVLFICLSITKPSKAMLQINPSMAATQGKFGNPRICSFPPSCAAQFTAIRHQVPDLGNRYPLNGHEV